MWCHMMEALWLYIMIHYKPQYEFMRRQIFPTLNLYFILVCTHRLSPRTRSGKRWLITLRAPHWDVQNNYLCLAATQDPSGEVIILTRGCSLQSQLIHINSAAWATRAIWMHGSNYTHYWTRQGPRNQEFLVSYYKAKRLFNQAALQKER